MKIEATKSLVRPLITLSFVWAYVAACFCDVQCIDKLETLTTATVAFWFGGRTKGGDGNGG